MIKVGGALGQLGKAIATPEGRAVTGTVLFGPVGGLAGYLSSEEGRKKAEETISGVGKKIMPSAPGAGVGGQQAEAADISKGIAGTYGGIAQEGIKAAQETKAPQLAPTAQAGGIQPLELTERVTAPTLRPAVMAQPGQVGAAPTVAPGFAQYIAGLSPEQMQAAQLERTAAAGPAQIQAAEEGRTFQQALAQQLMGQATGVAPSLAEQQLKQAQERALKQQIAQAASVRGGPAAAAQQRQLGAQLAETQQAQMAEAAEARIKEQQAAQQILGQTATQLRTADVEIATEQARLQQQAALEGRKLTSEEARTQAGFIQEAKRANQAAINDLTARKAELTLRAQQGDQQAATDLQKVQAQLDTEVNLDNARRVDDMVKEQARLQQQAAMGNQQAVVELQKLNAQLQVDVQKFNASEANQMARADAATKAEYDRMKNDMIKYYTSLGYDAQQAQVKTMLEIAGQKITEAGNKASAQAAQMQAGGQMIGGLGTAVAAGAAAFSDINVKTNIKGTSLLKDLAKAKPYEYEYKSNEFGTPGKHQSLMAQDIEKVPFLQKIVFETGKGKVVDYGKALPSMLAAQAEMAKEILELKKKRGK